MGLVDAAINVFDIILCLILEDTFAIYVCIFHAKRGLHGEPGEWWFNVWKVCSFLKQRLFDSGRFSNNRIFPRIVISFCWSPQTSHKYVEFPLANIPEQTYQFLKGKVNYQKIESSSETASRKIDSSSQMNTRATRDAFRSIRLFPRLPSEILAAQLGEGEGETPALRIVPL